MPRVKFEDGIVINFDKQPTQQDIDEAYNFAKSQKATQPISQPQESIIDIFKPSAYSPQAIGERFKEALKETYTEGVSPIASGLSTLALGIPKAFAKTQGVKEIIYPEQKTFAGKTLRFGAEAAGLLGGGALKGGEWLAGKTLSKLVAPKLIKAVAKGAITGGVMGALQTPEEGKGILKPAERLKQVATWGGLGGLFPLAGVGLSKAGEIVTKSGRWVAKNIGGITDATVTTIKRLGANRVFDPLKAKADYITQDLTFKVQTKITQAIQNFTPNIQKFAQEKLKIPESAINTIKKSGINAVNKVRQLYANSTDAISQKISQGFAGMRELADKSYQDAVGAFKGDTINSQPFYQSIQRGLRQKGWIDLQGNPTTRYKGGLDTVSDKLTDLYLDMRGTVTAQGKRIAGQIMSKEDFFTYRDALSGMLKEKPSDRLVMQAKNALYNSAEQSGMTGLRTARDLERKVFEMEGKFLDSQGNLKALGKENNLNRFHKLTQDQIRQLREIENYIGEKFVNDLDALTAGQYLDEFAKITPKTIASDLIRAKNPNWTKYIKSQYDELLGEKNFKNLYDDLMAHFANIDFELVSETPGAGGGIYPSRAGILRGIISKGTKEYYKKIAPQTEKIGKAIKRIPLPEIYK